MAKRKQDPRAPFPKYLMIVDGEKKFMTLNDAGVTFDNGHCKVEIGGEVLKDDFSIRPILDEERREIADIADEYSANK